ncbi:alanine/ornithine racemase family PLP-dependent enzyme [Phytoactinopolyspora halotolerans]|uniref:Alanine/ornithine racemase family PLP-dependent enzyme n=1 Tax=Phytoactinopolyspora halotolerans TaxID=1981512 RepID=A0A6L9SJ63_9ACTN|nr:alanine/ornithine racemase family PLP-dependent enzyme [Phytoactinopolyspora halotolerans]NEE04452.1 alanine/ornithine racemase family PLP-dependent enzyme [Phytoactinopolyspora halotolerans]
MTAPRLEIDLVAITHNTSTLVDRLRPKGIRVTGVSKATLGSPGVAAAMLRGGVTSLGDSRVENLARLRSSGIAVPLTLIRSPMLSQVDLVVRSADVSLNTEAVVLDALSAAAIRQHTTHAVVVMVELGDLREGVAAADIVDLARTVGRRPGLRLAGLGTNLACQCGVVPDKRKMDELSRLAEQVERTPGHKLSVVSGGNSANLNWALTTDDVGRIDELRLGESILLGTEPLHRRPIDGLRTDAFTLVAEVIETKAKPAQPWGEIAQAAYGVQPPRRDTGTVRQAILAVGRQDVDPDGITPPPGIVALGMSSDHLVVDVGDHGVSVGDELTFRLDYSALVRAMTSPFVTKAERSALPRVREPAHPLDASA